MRVLPNGLGVFAICLSLTFKKKDHHPPIAVDQTWQLRLTRPLSPMLMSVNEILGLFHVNALAIIRKSLYFYTCCRSKNKPKIARCHGKNCNTRLLNYSGNAQSKPAQFRGKNAELTTLVARMAAGATLAQCISIRRLHMTSHIWCQKKWPTKSCNLC